MIYRQKIAPLRSDGSDFHVAPNSVSGRMVRGQRCSICGWLTNGYNFLPHRRREDGQGWEYINSEGLIIFDPAPLISEEDAVELILKADTGRRVFGLGRYDMGREGARG